MNRDAFVRGMGLQTHVPSLRSGMGLPTHVPPLRRSMGLLTHARFLHGSGDPCHLAPPAAPRRARTP